MNIQLFSFSKRNNSTAIPRAADAINITAQLKDDTSVMNPILVFTKDIASSAVFSPNLYNYAFIPYWSRYYFITDWQYKLGVWEATLNVDVLASFKAEIGNSTQYVVRSAYTHNGEIMDGLYPTTAETKVNATLIPSGDTHYVSLIPGGYYIVGIISNSSADAIGAITYYQMTPQQLMNLKAYMLSDVFISQQGLSVQSVVDVLPTELLKTLYNPYQYIASCEWFPFAPTEIPADASNTYKIYDDRIQFGWWKPDAAASPEQAIAGYRIKNGGCVRQIQFFLPIYSHEQRFTRGVYLDHTPFSDRMLYYIPYGSIPINDDSIIGGDRLNIQIEVDFVLGDSVLSVYHERPTQTQGQYTNMGLIYRTSAKLSVPIQLAQATVDLNGTVYAAGIQGVSEAVQGLLGGKGLYGAIKNGIDGVLDAATNPPAQLQTSGSNGSLAQYANFNKCYWVQKWRIVADDDNTHLGRPLYETKRINTLSGYIMCANADVNLACMESERIRITDFLNNGFFYE